MLWDQVLAGYPLAAIRFAFDKWITNGRKFPVPADIAPLCISYAEQMEVESYEHPKRGQRIDGGNAQILLLWNMVIDRKTEFAQRGETYVPLTTKEWDAMVIKSKSGTYVSLKDSSRYYPNGNAKYNRELTQFMEARRKGGTL